MNHVILSYLLIQVIATLWEIQRGKDWEFKNARTSHLPLRTFQSGLQSFYFLFPKAQRESPVTPHRPK